MLRSEILEIWQEVEKLIGNPEKLLYIHRRLWKASTSIVPIVPEYAFSIEDFAVASTYKQKPSGIERIFHQISWYMNVSPTQMIRWTLSRNLGNIAAYRKQLILAQSTIELLCMVPKLSGIQLHICASDESFITWRYFPAKISRNVAESCRLHAFRLIVLIESYLKALQIPTSFHFKVLNRISRYL